MLVYDNDKIKQAYFTYAVEESLCSVSQLLYERTLERLGNDFGTGIELCFMHPQYLKNILHDLCGDSYTDVLEKISSELAEFDSDKNIFRIIQALRS